MSRLHLLRQWSNIAPLQDIVIFRDGAELTLEQVFQSLKLSAYDLSIDTLDMHAHQDSFHRFDKFNLKYNPIGESRLREIFLKIDNRIDGRYFAELTRGGIPSSRWEFRVTDDFAEVMTDLQQSKYQVSTLVVYSSIKLILEQYCEWRVSIYGRSADEWDKIAKWVINNKLFSHNVRWLIQVPRLYNIYKENGVVRTFEDIVISRLPIPWFHVPGLNFVQVYSARYSRSLRIRHRTQNSTFSCSASSALIVWTMSQRRNAESIANSRTLVSGTPHRIRPSRTGKSAHERLLPVCLELYSVLGFITCMPTWPASTIGDRHEVLVR